MTAEQSTNKKPNIVFFLWDNLGWGEVGCYGGGILRGADRSDHTSSSRPSREPIAPLRQTLDSTINRADCGPSHGSVRFHRNPNGSFA